MSAETAPRLRVLFVGGGTGGHLTPALALAEELAARGHAVRFLTSGRAVERRYLDGAVDALPLHCEGRGPLGWWRWLRSFAAVRREARAFRADVVVALGGRASAGALAVAAPRVLLEGNAVAGRSVRLLRPFARLVLVQFPETAGLTGRRGVVVVGPLLRAAAAPVPRAEARRRLELPATGPVLLALGGSQGAAAVHRAVARLLPEVAVRGGHVRLLCGPGRAAEVAALAAAWPERLSVREHEDAMGAAYAAADLALARGGASTLGELWAHGVPAVVLPYPHHRDRQQEHNARALAPGVEWLDETVFDAAAARRVAALLHDPDELDRRRRALRDRLAALAVADGRAAAARALESLAVEESGAPCA